MYDYVRKGDVGRARALAKLRNLLAPAVVTTPCPKAAAMWTWSQPRGAVLTDPETPGEAQDAILIRYGFAWIEGKRALGRGLCYDRTRPILEIDDDRHPPERN
jgi:hypothetical protein